MTLRIGDTAPDFHAETTQGNFKFHDWIGENWVLFFSHPKDFTPICTTEIGLMSKIQTAFTNQGVKVIGHSADSLRDHHKWIKDIEELSGEEITFPIIADIFLKVAKLYDMLPAGAIPGLRSPADNATVRAVYIIGPDKKIKLMSFYPMTVGRDFDEILRSIECLQLNAKYKVVTPANWRPGDDLVIPPSVSNAEATQLFPGGWCSKTPYLRVLPYAAISRS